MPGLIIDGRVEDIPGLTITNYKAIPKLKLKAGEDMRARNTRWIRSIVLHNTKNIQTVVKPSYGPSTNLGDRIAKLWSTDGRNAGAHISVDWDGTICCHCDLLQDAAYHASAMNEVSIGIEIYEDGNGVVFEGQLSAVVKLVVWLCQRFGIQMQMPWAMNNAQISRIKAGGSDCVGVFGHCHNNHKDKAYDPGFDIMKRLLVDAKFKEFSFDPHTVADDKAYWMGIQKRLGLNPDGVPGPKTRDALQARGFKYGLYDFTTIPIA